MKKTILTVMVGAIFLSNGSVAQQNDIKYQTDTKPNSAPSYDNNQGGNQNNISPNPEQARQIAEYQRIQQQAQQSQGGQQMNQNSGNMQQGNGQSNTNTTIDANGNRVVTTTEYQKLPEQNNTKGNNKAQDYSKMSMEQKFWNIKNSEIKNIQRKYEEKRAAIQQDISPGRCVQGHVDISNQPGATLPLLRLDKNNIATVLMTDVYGKAWSIDYIINSSDVKVVYDQENPEVSSFSVQSQSNNGQGNFVVKLKENPIPIVFNFINNQKDVDCMMTAKLTIPNPKTEISGETINASAMDSSLNSVLYGVAPTNSKPLRVSNPSAQAWLLDDNKVVIRTKYKLLSPAYESVSRSPDGTFVYKTQFSPIYNYRYNDVIGSFEVRR